MKNEKRTKDRTVRNNCCRARHEEEVLVKPETPEVQKHLRPQHMGSKGECKEEGLKTEKTQEAQGSRTDGWMGESKLIVTFRGPGGKQKPAFEDMRRE